MELETEVALVTKINQWAFKRNDENATQVYNKLSIKTFPIYIKEVAYVW